MSEHVVPTADQIRAYLLANGWKVGESGRAAYLMVTMGHTVRMLHEPTEYDRDKACFDIALAEGRHPADVYEDILSATPLQKVANAAVTTTPANVSAPVAFLRQRRIDLGVSQREVARQAGFAPSLLSDYESGRHEPTTSKLIALADALGCDVTFTVRPAPPVRGHFDSLDELRQDMHENAWARRVAAPAKPDDIEEIRRRLSETCMRTDDHEPHPDQAGA